MPMHPARVLLQGRCFAGQPVPARFGSVNCWGVHSFGFVNTRGARQRGKRLDNAVVALPAERKRASLGRRRGAGPKQGGGTPAGSAARPARGIVHGRAAPRLATSRYS